MEIPALVSGEFVCQGVASRDLAGLEGADNSL
jgi:hypothetical protein